MKSVKKTLFLSLLQTVIAAAVMLASGSIPSISLALAKYLPQNLVTPRVEVVVTAALVAVVPPGI